ncbi:hypothetical protein ZIOFF_039553 [Zingiber officinale]|uniref:C2 domain-containing protein n=1 Tax=Zingiber officinale TaxID=94328 RepID=A0A8J5G4R0_ZINOF|nr:hypothetical protein ZIOFF_039553 [Zingiber officinale]
MKRLLLPLLQNRVFHSFSSPPRCCPPLCRLTLLGLRHRRHRRRLIHHWEAHVRGPGEGHRDLDQEKVTEASKLLNGIQSRQQPNSVLAFLKSCGFDAQKFRDFEDLGLSPTDIVHLVRSKDALVKLFKRNQGILAYSIEKKIQPNVELLREFAWRFWECHGHRGVCTLRGQSKSVQDANEVILELQINMEFLINEAGYASSYISTRPLLLIMSLERRLILHFNETRCAAVSTCILVITSNCSLRSGSQAKQGVRMANCIGVPIRLVSETSTLSVSNAEVFGSVGDDLKPKTRNGSANPFVSVEFRGKRRRTATKLYSLSPCWDETLLFPVADPLDLPQSTIEVSVYHDNSNFNSTAQHRNSFLGRVRLSGSSVAPCRLDAALQLCPLDKRSFFSNVRGELTLRVYVVAEDHDVPVLNSVQAEAEADAGCSCPELCSGGGGGSSIHRGEG